MTQLRPNGRPGNRLALWTLAAAAAALAITWVRGSSIRRTASQLGTKIPRGAMAIRRESLVDLTVDGRPVRQTVFIAESADQAEVIGGEAEEFLRPMNNDIHEPDPSEDNVSGTATELVDGPHQEDDLDASELYAEAEAVLAEAQTIEREAAESGTVAAELADEEALEESFEAAPPASVTHVDAHDGACPTGFPIKVRFATGRYHVPTSANYLDVVADACYQSVQAAETDGFSPSPLD